MLQGLFSRELTEICWYLERNLFLRINVYDFDSRSIDFPEVGCNKKLRRYMAKSSFAPNLKGAEHQWWGWVGFRVPFRSLSSLATAFP